MTKDKDNSGPPQIEILPPRVGRPTDYDPAFCERVQELGAKGYSRAQIAADIGCARETLANWEKAHPEFLGAMTRAKDLELAWWEHAGQRGMFMTGFSANAWGLQARNRFPKDYRDKQDVKHSGGLIIETVEYAGPDKIAE